MDPILRTKVVKSNLPPCGGRAARLAAASSRLHVGVLDFRSTYLSNDLHFKEDSICFDECTVLLSSLLV